MAQVSRFPLPAPTKSRSTLISSGSRGFTSSLLPARGEETKLQKTINTGTTLILNVIGRRDASWALRRYLPLQKDLRRFSSDRSQLRNLSMLGRLTQTFPELVAFNCKYVLRFKLTARATCKTARIGAHAHMWAHTSVISVNSSQDIISFVSLLANQFQIKTILILAPSTQQVNTQHANICHVHRLCLYFTFPCTTACSPWRMAFPGAETKMSLIFMSAIVE